MPYDLRQLRYVLALADHGSFGRAATAVNLTQPALSRSIQSLEENLGSPLFQRTSEGVVPTDIGRLFIQRARDVVQLADDINRELFSHRTLQSGRLRVGAGPFPGQTLVASAAAAFARSYPRVTIQLDVRNWDELLSKLRSRDLDLFVAEVSTLTNEPDLDVQPLSAQRVFLVARRGHPLDGKPGVTATDTFGYPFVAPSRIPPRLLEPMLAAQRLHPDPEATRRVFPSIECSATGAIKRILLGSDAITGLALSAVEDELEAGTLSVLGAESWLTLNYGVVRLKGRPMNHAAEKFHSLLHEMEQTAALEEERLFKRWGGHLCASARAG